MLGCSPNTPLHATFLSRVHALPPQLHLLAISTCIHTALCLLNMQNRKHKPAKGATSEEFADFMGECMVKVLQNGAPYPSAFSALWMPLFCFDKPNVHTGSSHLLQQKGIQLGHILPQPRYGSDFNKAIEHVWGIIARAYREWLRETTGRRTALECRNQLMYLLSTHVGAESVMRDVLSLPEMWANIAGDLPNGTDGAYADRHLR